MSKEKNKLQIRNSTAEFLVFTAQAGEDTIEVRVQDETVWLTQKLMAELFQTTPQNITIHLKNIFKEGELNETATCKDFLQVGKEGQRVVERNQKFYNLDVVISIGYRINSQRATQFRQWATGILRDFAIRGYVMDKERLKNGQFFNKEYFDHLLEEIREIRASERRFYQKITDIYSTATDYNPDAEITQTFFAAVQNRLHFAIHGHTAAELIINRADSKKEHMGLSTWKNAPTGKIVKTDVSIAKNYLNEKEIKNLDRFVTMYLDYAETQAERNIPMTMQDWSEKLNAFLKFNEKEILNNSGKVTQAIAKAFAESEFEKYRIVQDKLFESDFDREVKKIQKTKGKEIEELRGKSKDKNIGKSR
jgi:hypothetical protein